MSEAVTVIALVRDLFFCSKLDAVAQVQGAKVLYAASLELARARCAGVGPAVVLVDLSDPSFPPAETMRALGEAASGMRLVGFASHVDLKALAAARAAGFEHVLSRDEFTARLPELLKPAA